MSFRIRRSSSALAKWILFCLCFVIPQTAISQIQDWESHYKKICDDATLSAPDSRFPEELRSLWQGAKEIRKLVCDQRGSEPSIALRIEYNSRMLSFLHGLEGIVPGAFADIGPDGRATLRQDWLDLPPGRVPPVFFNGCFQTDAICEIDLNLQSFGQIGIDKDSCGGAPSLGAGLTCRQYLNEVERLYRYAQGSLSQLSARATSSYLKQLDARWGEYAEISKSQHLLELLANGYFFQRDKVAYAYSEPPSKQLVLFHPSAVMEWVDDAAEGSQTKASLLLEWIGIDFWQQDRWYLPSGASIVSVYSDREGADDLGLGLSVNFRSKFSVGVVDRDGDLGVFVTLDLLKILQEKSETIEAYRGVVDF